MLLWQPGRRIAFTVLVGGARDLLMGGDDRRGHGLALCLLLNGSRT